MMVSSFRGSVVLALGLGLLAGCGGDQAFTKGGNNAGGDNTPPGSAYTKGQFAQSEDFAGLCAAPRKGTDPDTGKPYPDKLGTFLDEKNFLRSWTNETYLWFDEVPDVDPASASSNTAAGVLTYFDQQKTSAKTPSGRPKDQFHFTYDTAEYYALSQSGISFGYGISWDLVSSQVPRQLIVQYVQAGSEAAKNGIQRGDEILTADGVDLSNGSDINALNTALFSPPEGSSHTFTLIPRAGGATKIATLKAGLVTLDPVPLTQILPTPTGNVGYIQFDDQMALAEQKLVEAITTLQGQNLQDLILDMRYNGGGYLAIASELAYMIAGPDRTAGKIFERLAFNSNIRIINPDTGVSLTSMPFLDKSQGYSDSFKAGQALPTLALDRVYVLTTADTCSASESVINGLQGVDVEVIQIGGETCGKPYGFYPEDNCGTTYFSIQFQGVNEKDFGDYADGFSPATRAGEPADAQLPGCSVADDYQHDLGDPAERMLKVALDYRANNRSCALATSSAGVSRVRATAASHDGLSLRMPDKAPWRENRILR
jgi:hypothetical protein